jgi:hypothetical protein
MSYRSVRLSPVRLRCLALIVSALASCAKPQAEASRPPLPVDLPEACPAGVLMPKPPARPRTVEQLGEWARRTASAGVAAEHARAECARDYQRLRAWALAPF